MANTFDVLDRPSSVIDRASRVMPRPSFAHWLLRLPLAGVLLQYGIDKFPISADEAAGFGVPVVLWALAALGEIAVGILLIAGGVLRGSLGDLATRLAGAGAAMIVFGVLYVAYWAPPLDMLLFNQFHVLMIANGLFLALAGNAHGREPGR
jgi:uncharacterized membrane protein YphA (DoxX/SURF4 family)